MPKKSKSKTTISFPDKLILTRNGKDDDFWYSAFTMQQIVENLKHGEEVAIYALTKMSRVKKTVILE